MKIRFTQNKRTILQLMQTSNLKKKLRMIDRFNGINERDTISILLKVLEDKSWALREKAAYKLIEYGNRVIPRLERLLDRGYWYTRAAACLVLGEIGNPRSGKVIVQLLIQDDNPTVKKEAGQALKKLLKKDPAVFHACVKKMNVSDEEYTRLCAMIRDIDPEIATMIENAPPEE